MAQKNAATVETIEVILDRNAGESTEGSSETDLNLSALPGSGTCAS
ncbi:hypothetical protein NZK35_23235 [Stieleria sp. ICT_E10.1]|nr:hypothetical protein [Stieleria sedimenti]MCS7469577.1 hypothetical protein [Stieleria sedimenti]